MGRAAVLRTHLPQLALLATLGSRYVLEKETEARGNCSLFTQVHPSGSASDGNELLWGVKA